MILHGECIDHLKTLDSDSVDALVTDPPYGLSKEPDAKEVLTKWIAGEDYQHTGGGFMGKTWDSFVPGPALWREVYRVMKPGAHGLVFAGTRTWDLMGMALRLAGFEIRDTINDLGSSAAIAWVYGQGFPKSLDVSKAIDKMAGVEREVVGPSARHGGGTNHVYGAGMGDGAKTMITAPATEDAKRWAGWGTALKPSWEPIILIRKPLSEKNVAANVLKHGTGAINIDGCRVEFSGDADEQESKRKNQHGEFGSGPMTNEVYGKFDKPRENYDPPGRFPANLIVSGFARDVMDEQSGTLSSGARVAGDRKRDGEAEYRMPGGSSSADSGGASRFFADCADCPPFYYCAKPSKRERSAGCERLAERVVARSNGGQAEAKRGKHVARAEVGSGYDATSSAKNHHPTVKPLKLMRYLCRLITPPGGIVLDPFAGSGTTGVAAIQEGFRFIGIEREAEYVEIARARVAYALKESAGQISLPIEIEETDSAAAPRISESTPPDAQMDLADFIQEVP